MTQSRSHWWHRFDAARIVDSRHFVPFEPFIAAGAFCLRLAFLIVWVFKLRNWRWYAHLRARDATGASSESAATISVRYIRASRHASVGTGG